MLNPTHDLATRPRNSIAIEIIRLLAPLLILGLGILGFLVLWSMRDAPARERQEVPPPLVETTEVQAHHEGIDIEVDGLVVPYREIAVAAEVAGRVKYKADICRAGNFVTEGTLLIEIDPADYLLEVRRLTKELQQSKVFINELDIEATDTEEMISLAENDLDLQRREVQRLSTLSQKRYVSDSNYDASKRAEVISQNGLLKLRSQLRLLKTRRDRLVQAEELASTQLEKAQLDEKRTKILAPVDGVVVQDMVEQDSYVQKGTSLVSLEDTSLVEVKCNLQMEDLYWVWQQSSTDRKGSEPSQFVTGYEIPPTPVTVIYRLGPREFIWSGTLARYDGIGVDERTRTMPCRVRVDDPRGGTPREPDETSGSVAGPPALVRGMYVTVLIHANPPGGAILRVPDRAVRPGNVVWLLEDGKLHRRQIQVAQLYDGAVLIDGDSGVLSEGARVVVSPISNPYDGMVVRDKKT